jgi:hypothetical protein
MLMLVHQVSRGILLTFTLLLFFYSRFSLFFHRNVVGLAMGYSKNIVVDMGFCLQGNEEDELPEVLMGACTCVRVDATTVKKL